MHDSTQIEVKILSYDRWDLLQRLLASLAALRTKGFSWRCEIIDNSEASPLTMQQIELVKEKYNADYYYAGLNNIAAARNVALARSRAPYLAFIDDDEQASSDWLAALYAEMQKSGSDVVFGQSIPRIMGERTWLHQADLFHSGVVESTANCLIRMNEVRQARVKFDERFGKCGGSDLEFFTRLRCLSFRFSYAPSAITYESYERSRDNLRWVARRAFRCGGTRGAVFSKYQRNQYAQEVVGAPREMLRSLSPLADKTPLGRRFWRFCFFAGLFFFSLSGRVLSEYDRGHFRFARFRHPRWSFPGIYWARLKWRGA